MSLINFNTLVDLLNSATPSSGFSVGYDLDSVLKQKDQFGVITPIGGGLGGQDLISVLNNGNESGTFSILMGTSSSLKSMNGGGQLDLDAYGSVNEVLLSNDNANWTEQSQLYLSPTYVELSNLDNNGSTSIIGGYTSSIGRPYADIQLGRYGDGGKVEIKTYAGSNIIEMFDSPTPYTRISSYGGEITLNVLNLEFSIFNNLGGLTTSSYPNDKASAFLSTKSSTALPNIVNSPIIGGLGLTASVSNTVYLGNSVNINNAYTLPSTDGTNGQVLKTDGSGTVTWGADSAFQTLQDVLSYGNDSVNYNIIMGTSTYIQSSANQNRIYFDGIGLALTTDSGGLVTSHIQLDQSGITISTPTYSMVVNESSITTSNSQGLKYTFDYSATFVTQSLVSKKYVDDLVRPLNSYRTAYVDTTYGNDTSGTLDRFDKPYQTISAAMTALIGAYPSGNLYIKAGQYAEDVYLQNNIDVFCEAGVVFTGGGFRDIVGGVTCKVLGWASFIGASSLIQPLTVDYNSTIDFEFDKCNNVHSFCRISDGNINIRGNSIITLADNAYGLSIRGSANVNITITEKIVSGYKAINFSNSYSGTTTINCPKIQVDTDIASFGYVVNSSVAVLTDNDTTGTITINGDISNTTSDLVYTIANPDFITRFDSSTSILGGYVTITGNVDGGFTKGLYVGGTVSNGQLKLKGNITARRESVVVNTNLVSTYLSEGTLKSFGSGSLPYVVSVVGTSSQVFIKDSIAWNTLVGTSLMWVFSTQSTVAIYDTLGYSPGTTGSFIFTTQSVNVGFHSVRSNKDNVNSVTDIFSPSGFIYDTGLIIPNF